MGVFKDQAKGAGRAIKGKMKEEYGEATGDPTLEGEGRRDQAAGRVQRDAARAAGRIEGAGREISGTVRREAGDLVDDRDTQARGEADRLKGRIQRKLNE